MMPRVGVLSLWHETNTYSRRLATLDAWRDYELLAGDAIGAGHRGTRSVVGGFLEALGARAVPIFAAGAWPSGATPRADFEQLIDRFEEQLDAVGELDGLAVNLHGAMVAEGSDDVEAEFVLRLRARFGDIPIAAVLDLHGNPSVELADAVDILIAYRTYPHVDMWECGFQAAELLLRTIDGARLSTAIAKIPLLTAPLAQGTDGTRGVVLRSLEAAAAAAGLERVSVLPGFAYQDVARAGMSVLVVHDDEHADMARRLADDTAATLQATADSGGFTLRRPDAATAVQQAMASTSARALLTPSW